MSTRRRTWANDPRVARLAELSQSPPTTWPTRDRILYEAAALMSSRGFHGATTRDIAEAVGIQQPSIFNHFPNKTAILAELFEFDQVIPMERLIAIVGEGGSPACQLYRYVEWQTLWYLEIPFDLRGLREEQTAELGLEAPRRALQQFRKVLNTLVREGLRQGQFAADGLDFLFPALNALAFEVTRIVHFAPPRGGHRRLSDSAASFVLRATLRDPSTLDDVRAEAAAIGRPRNLFG